MTNVWSQKSFMIKEPLKVQGRQISFKENEKFMEVGAESAFQLLFKKLLLVGYTESQRRISTIIQKDD